MSAIRNNDRYAYIRQKSYNSGRSIRGLELVPPLKEALPDGKPVKQQARKMPPSGEWFLFFP